MDKQQLRQIVESKRDQMVENMMSICSVPAVNPKNGGTGEFEKTQVIMGILDRNSIEYEIFEVPDANPNVKEGKRISVYTKIAGTKDTDKTLWFIGHTDTVSPGDLDAWDTDPFTPTKKDDGCIYGLGVEDNGQAIICALQTLLIMKEHGIQASCNVGFLFVADEECGSVFGLKPMVTQGIFGSKDEAVVPDAGSLDGSFVEIAEKSMAWVNFTVYGKQAHGSMPHLGINAHSVGCHFAVELEDTLKETFAFKDPLFDPPYSTFELTQKLANVDSVNILPGKDCFSMDMRVLPNFKLDEVLSVVDKIIAKYEYAHKVKIEYDFTQRVDAPPPTPADSPIVQNIVSSIKDSGVDAVYGGIGGGTCAAFLRDIGVAAVVWSTLIEMAHQPNERIIIENLVTDCYIFLLTILKY